MMMNVLLCNLHGNDQSVLMVMKQFCVTVFHQEDYEILMVSVNLTRNICWKLKKVMNSR